MAGMRSSLVDEWGYFTAMPEVVIKAWPSLGTDAVAMFLYLRYKSNRQDGHPLEGCAWPDLETISRETGMHYRHIGPALRALEKGGLLKREKRFGRSVVYRLVRPPDVAPSSPSTIGGTGACSPPSPSTVGGTVPPTVEDTVPPPLEEDLDRVYTDRVYPDRGQVRAADSPANRSKADRLAGDHRVLEIMTGLGISDGQARSLSIHFTPSEAEALADVARRQEPDDLGAYAARLFRDHSEVSRDG